MTTTEASGLTSIGAENTTPAHPTTTTIRRRRSHGETSDHHHHRGRKSKNSHHHHIKQSASLSSGLSLTTKDGGGGEEEGSLSSSRSMSADFHVMVHDDEEKEEETNATTPTNGRNNNNNQNAAEELENFSDAEPSPSMMKHDHSQSTLHSRSTSHTTSGSQYRHPSRRRRRGGGGGARSAATIREQQRSSMAGSTSTTTTGLAFPRGQYECTLVRRAIFPGPPPPNTTTTYTTAKEDYGDTSLGMKLNVTPTGHVVVQHVGCLHDGRASPAQLCTNVRIQPGDVLVAIDGVAASALAALQVLKAPASPLEPCRRQYRLRFAAGEGRAWMLRQQQQQATTKNDSPAKLVSPATSMDAADSTTLQSMPSSDLMGLFPMVDQLSGMPLFPEGMPGPPAVVAAAPPPPPPAVDDDDNHNTHPESVVPTIPEEGDDESPAVAAAAAAASSSPLMVVQKKKKQKRPLSIDERISTSLAATRRKDRNYYLLVEEEATISTTIEQQQHNEQPTLAERHAMGREALTGAGQLLDYVQDYDVRKLQNVRSFTSWNTTLSLYSRASTRRRRVLLDSSQQSRTTARSRRSSSQRCRGGESSIIPEMSVLDDGTDVGIQGSSVAASSNNNSGDNNGTVDGDEVLLRLAARDEIWRTQVVDFLRTVVAQDADVPTTEQPTTATAATANPDINSALSNELGNFLFGENMTKILAKHATPRALPPEEVTAVLFDLATRLSSTVPDEIKATGSVLLGDQAGWMLPLEEEHSKDALRVLQQQSSSSSAQQDTDNNNDNTTNDFTKATRFLLDQALPAWLESFRPLGWEHRRMLWPLVHNPLRGGGGGSTVASSDDDSLTVDSSMMSRSVVSTRRKKRKDIRELIEEQELDIETRGETYVIAGDGCAMLPTVCIYYV